MALLCLRQNFLIAFFILSLLTIIKINSHWNQFSISLSNHYIDQLVTTQLLRNTFKTASTTQINNASSNITNSISTFINISKIIQLRTTIPSQCTHKSNILNNVTDNWLSYYLRCDYKPKYKTHYEAVSWGLRTGVTSKELIFLHTWKAGGTTIIDGILSLNKRKKISLTLIDSHRLNRRARAIKKFVNKINNNAIVFSFVRDPVSRYLSAFFEISKRAIVFRQPSFKRQIETTFNITLRQYEQMNGVQLLREMFIKYMLENIDNNPRYYVDGHFAPNMMFLGNRNRIINYSFIGNLDKLNNNLPEIIKPLIIDTQLKYNEHYSSLMMRKYFIHKRYRQNKTDEYITPKIGYSSNHYKNLDVSFNITQEELKRFFNTFVINTTMLSDMDINNLCNIYWMDYLCFPFEIPPACNLTDLIIKHYGIDVEYKTCY